MGLWRPHRLWDLPSATHWAQQAARASRASWRNSSESWGSGLGARALLPARTSAETNSCLHPVPGGLPWECAVLFGRQMDTATLPLVASFWVGGVLRVRGPLSHLSSVISLEPRGPLFPFFFFNFGEVWKGTGQMGWGHRGHRSGGRKALVSGSQASRVASACQVV